MSDSPKKPVFDLNELASMLAQSRMKNDKPPAIDLKSFFQPPLTSLVSSPSKPLLPFFSPQPPPPSKDLKSPLTKRWNHGFYKMIQIKLKQITITNSKRIKNITAGLTMPEITSIPIGSAKKMEAAILFFDLENFTTIASALPNEHVLYFLNLIIPTMMSIVKRWNGEIEKNTGDGLMAIFGTETRNSFLIARDTIECAMAMRYVMLNDIHLKLVNDGLPAINFRIGIDMGEVLISRIGINNLNFLTVVGDSANRASKLQALANQNGICFAENFYNNLHPAIQPYCLEDIHDDWKWHYKSGQPYRFFHFNFQWPDPKLWAKVNL